MRSNKSSKRQSARQRIWEAFLTARAFQARQILGARAGRRV